MFQVKFNRNFQTIVQVEFSFLIEWERESLVQFFPGLVLLLAYYITNKIEGLLGCCTHIFNIQKNAFKKTPKQTSWTDF